MRKLLIVFAMIAASVVLAQPANANNEGQVCPGLTSGKIDVSGNKKTVTITAPAGFLIDSYCVKAGSEDSDAGPVTVEVDPPAKTVTISHPSGKDISHYSAHYVRATVPDDEEEPPGDGGNGGQEPANQDRDLPATGGLPLWVLVLAGPLTVAGLIVMRRRQSS